MLVSGALFGLFVAGIWLYCLTDVMLTPAWEFRGLPKHAWIVIIAVTLAAGALAWLVVRRGLQSQRWTDEDDAVARHPAGRAMAADSRAVPRGPDDDPAFLRMLDRAIHGHPQPGEEA